MALTFTSESKSHRVQLGTISLLSSSLAFPQSISGKSHWGTGRLLLQKHHLHIHRSYPYKQDIDRFNCGYPLDLKRYFSAYFIKQMANIPFVWITGELKSFFIQMVLIKLTCEKMLSYILCAKFSFHMEHISVCHSLCPKNCKCLPRWPTFVT